MLRRSAKPGPGEERETEEGERLAEREDVLATALRFRGEGTTVGKIARRLGRHRSTIYRWIKDAERMRAGGKRQRGPGRPSHMGAFEEGKLRDRLDQDPRTRGHRESGWTTELVQVQLRSITHYPYTLGSTVKLMRRLGYRKVRITHGSDGGQAGWYWVKKDPKDHAPARTSLR